MSWNGYKITARRITWPLRRNAVGHKEILHQQLNKKLTLQTNYLKMFGHRALARRSILVCFPRMAYVMMNSSTLIHRNYKYKARTPWRRILSQKVTGTQLVQKLSALI
jgi:hypothetical protein